MATHSSVLAWRIPRTAEPGGLPSMGSHRPRRPGWPGLGAPYPCAAASLNDVPLPEESGATALGGRQVSSAAGLVPVLPGASSFRATARNLGARGRCDSVSTVSLRVCVSPWGSPYLGLFLFASLALPVSVTQQVCISPLISLCEFLSLCASLSRYESLCFSTDFNFYVGLRVR